MATGTLTPSPWQTVLDASGNPLVGAKVNTYLAGTTTPAATYTDVGLTVPNANPILTDSAGRYVAFLAPGVSYKFAVTDANGVTVKTVDNISSVPASASNLDLIGTAGEALTAGQAVYLSDGSGGKTAGQWYKADAANTYSSSGAVVVGMVPASIIALGSGTIRLSGQMTGLSALTLGSTYYVGTAGALTSTPPTNARVVGIADTTASLVLIANPGSPNADNGVNDFRLTLTTGTPITTADVTAATTLYCTPYRGNRIALFNSVGAATVLTSAEFSIAIPATTSQMYDVFAFSNAGVPTLELLAWTNDTTRATTITLATTGVYTKTADLTRRWLGSVRTTTVSGQTEDSVAKRFVWNHYHRVRRLLRVTEATDSWAYTLATWRQANGAAGNQVAAIAGLADASLTLLASAQANSAAGVTAVYTSIGLDSTTAPMANVLTGQSGLGTNILFLKASIDTWLPLGYHTLVWLERSVAVSTTTWYGDNGDSTLLQSGLSGWIEG